MTVEYWQQTQNYIECKLILHIANGKIVDC